MSFSIGEQCRLVGNARTQNGYALIEAMIAVGLIAIATAGMLAVMSNFANMQILADVKNEITNQLFELRTALSDPNTCKGNFAGIRLTGGTTAVDRTLRPLRAGSTTDLDSQSRLTPAPGSGVRVAAAGYRLIQTAVQNVYHLEVNFASEVKIGNQNFFRNISIHLIANDGVISECSSSGGTDMAGLCKSLDGVFEAATGKCDVMGPACAKMGGELQADGKCRMRPTSCETSRFSQTVPSGAVRSNVGNCGARELCIDGTWVMLNPGNCDDN